MIDGRSVGELHEGNYDSGGAGSVTVKLSLTAGGGDAPQWFCSNGSINSVIAACVTKGN